MEVEYDEFGPAKILEVYNPRVGMRGFVVIDSLALGPGKGGIRMTPTVSVGEVSKLARAMTWKNALAELPFGGAKSGIIANDREISKEKKQEIVEAFAEGLKSVVPEEYVAAPDMNMAEEEMKWFVEKVGSDKAATGKSKEMGGLPHELGSTGFGVYHSTLVALEHMGLKPENVTFAVEGFGNVGWFAAKFLTEKGAKMVAVSDSKGVACNKEGFSFDDVAKAKEEHGTVTKISGCEVLPSKEIINQEVDVLITAAIPDLIAIGDVDGVKAKLIVQGSNIPMTFDVEKAFHKKDVLIVPDFVANAGGVISSYAEYAGKSEDEMWKLVEDKIVKNTKLVLDKAKEEGCAPRKVAMDIAKERVRAKCEVCRL